MWLGQTLFLSVVPIPAKPIVADALSASIIGGIFGGAGIGIALRSGGSSGGIDIIVECSKAYDFRSARISPC